MYARVFSTPFSTQVTSPSGVPSLLIGDCRRIGLSMSLLSVNPSLNTFSPTFLRPATAYGVSPRLRFDIVLNNLVAWGMTVVIRTFYSAVMHACAHDTHMTAWIAAARLLAARRSEWSGTLVMIAQPAEETGQGAKAMLDDGLYQRFGTPDYTLAFHDAAQYPAGAIAYSLAMMEVARGCASTSATAAATGRRQPSPRSPSSWPRMTRRSDASCGSRWCWRNRASRPGPRRWCCAISS